mgnify:CR=1 FL=1
MELCNPNTKYKPDTASVKVKKNVYSVVGRPSAAQRGTQVGRTRKRYYSSCQKDGCVVCPDVQIYEVTHIPLETVLQVVKFYTVVI